MVNVTKGAGNITALLNAFILNYGSNWSKSPPGLITGKYKAMERPQWHIIAAAAAGSRPGLYKAP